MGIDNAPAAPDHGAMSLHPTLLSARAALAGLAALCLLALTAAAAHASTVTVAEGDTISAIAARHGVSVDALVAANGLPDADTVRAGATLTLPGSTGARASSGAASGGSGDGGSGGHVISAGETLSGIAARYGTTVGALAAANGLSEPYLIVAGRSLTIASAGSAASGTGTASSATSEAAGSAPSTGAHRVAPGETLSGIAAAHGTSVAALAAANGLADPHMIVAGRTLTLVSGGASAAASDSGAGATTGTAPQGWIPVAGAGAGVGDMISERARAHGVDPALARAVAWQESGWNQSVTSHVGATGVMQLMPGTAQWLGESVLGRTVDRHSAADNIDAGVAYLAWLDRETGGDTRTTVAAYYQGLTGVRERGWYDDTTDYVENVFALRERM